MKENYVYPVIFNTNEPGFIHIRIPAFNAESFVEEGKDAIAAAQDLLALEIWSREQEGRDLPPMERGHIENGEELIFVNIWTPYHISKVKEFRIKKTLTIPAWLNSLAENAKVNFSLTLEEALKEKLGISKK